MITLTLEPCNSSTVKVLIHSGRGVGRMEAKGAAAPTTKKKETRRERGERKRERKKGKEKGS